jgi:queuine tRNA-ribosyltransferase
LGLSKTKTGKPLAKVRDNHVEFSSIHDGSKHIFTPTGCIDIQCNLGSDIMMMLDVCAPVVDITKDQVEKYMHQTHRRAKEQFEHYTNDEIKYSQNR